MLGRTSVCNTLLSRRQGEKLFDSPQPTQSAIKPSHAPCTWRFIVSLSLFLQLGFGQQLSLFDFSLAR